MQRSPLSDDELSRQRVEQFVKNSIANYHAGTRKRYLTDVRERTHRASRRTRAVSACMAAVLVAMSIGIWLSPDLPTWESGPTPLEIALMRERARANDLKRQVDALTAELRKARPVAYDGVEAARAADLKRQVEELEDRLGIPRPPEVDGVQQARADDLSARLKAAEAKLKEGKPPVTDPTAAARAEDLARQNDALEAELTRPRPPEDPLANVQASLSKAQILGGRQMFGLYTAQSPFNYAEVNLVQSELNRKANIVGYFQSWAGDFRPDAVKQTWARGQIPLLTWESQPQIGSVTPDVPEFSMPKIYGGQYDDYIRGYARGISALGLPLILRFNHEMNGTWYPWSEVKATTGESINGNSKGDYVKMWRHVHDIFEQEGANAYVVWLWAPNRINAIPSQPPPKEFYPGDDYVDWIGMSGYYRPYDSGPYFTETHGKTLPLLREAGAKPLFLAEIGATELGGQKPAWINSLFDNLKRNPDIIGFAWFSLTVTGKHEGQTQTNDWRIDSSSASTRAASDRLVGDGWGLAP